MQRSCHVVRFQKKQKTKNKTTKQNKETHPRYISEGEKPTTLLRLPSVRLVSLGQKNSNFITRWSCLQKLGHVQSSALQKVRASVALLDISVTCRKCSKVYVSPGPSFLWFILGVWRFVLFFLSRPWDVLCLQGCRAQSQPPSTRPPWAQVPVWKDRDLTMEVCSAILWSSIINLTLCLQRLPHHVFLRRGQQNQDLTLRPKRLTSPEALRPLGLEFTFMCHRGIFVGLLALDLGFCHLVAQVQNPETIQVTPSYLHKFVAIQWHLSHLWGWDSVGMKAGNWPVSMCETQSLVLSCRLSLWIKWDFLTWYLSYSSMSWWKESSF